MKSFFFFSHYNLSGFMVLRVLDKEVDCLISVRKNDHENACHKHCTQKNNWLHGILQCKIIFKPMRITIIVL